MGRARPSLAELAGPFYPIVVVRAALDCDVGPRDNPAMSSVSSAEPAGITEPIARALDALIVGAAASFGLSILAVLATVFAAEGHLHAVAHLSLPAFMGIVIVIRIVHIVRRHVDTRDDTWLRARAVNAFDTRLAQLLSVAVPLAWLAGSVAILVRHSHVVHDLLAGVGFWLPLGAALWIFATFAWIDACRDRIAAGVDESDRNFRAYWQDLGRGR